MKNPHAQALARLGKGVSRTFTPEQKRRAAAILAKYRYRGGRKKGVRPLSKRTPPPVF